MSIESTIISVKTKLEKLVRRTPKPQIPEDPQISSEYDWLHAPVTRPILTPPDDWSEEIDIPKK